MSNMKMGSSIMSMTDNGSSSLSNMGPGVDREKLNALLDKKVHQIQIGFDRQVKDMKPFILDYACNFIKEKTVAVTQLLTKTHHGLVQ